ncbi:MAG: AIM24 family protein [Halobaculum sp.]|jgi:uncharacterized protein (AIM24 family)
MDLQEFVTSNEPDESSARFELENSKLLDIEVEGSIMTKAGAMVAHDGNLSFTGKSSAEGGITGFIKQAATSEGTPVMEVEGQGHVYLADQGKRIQPLALEEGEAISVNGNDVLAFENSVDYSIGTIGSIGGAQAAGLTNVYLTGPGHVAITTHGDPIVLQPPIKTDPSATVAWSDNLSPSIDTNRSLSDAIGQSSGERYQMNFSGTEGFVVVQPYEEGPQEQI